MFNLRVFSHSKLMGEPPSRRSSSSTLPFVILSMLVVLVVFMSFPLSFWQDFETYITITRSTLTWTNSPRDHVAMRIIPASSHFEMGSESWQNLLPPGGHTIHLSNADGTISTKTVAMFHQLRCLDILHDAYVEEGSHRTSTLVQHCLNYLRQTFLCHMDMKNEPQGSTFTRNGLDTLCYDWEGIYTEATRNFDAYSKQVTM